MVVFARKSKLARREEGGSGRKVSCSWYSDADAPLISAPRARGTIEEKNMVKERQLPNTEGVQGFMRTVDVVRVMVS